METKKLTILVVDDVPQNIYLLNGILSSDYRILFATSGAQALKIAADTVPDIILLDVMMPEMNGYEVCKKLKEDNVLKSIPVIFLTALNDFDSETQGLSLGAIDYIRKPYNANIVKLRIHNHLELKKTRDELFRLSNVDRLTGIPNRRAIFDYFEHEMSRALRNNRALGYMMIDIDFFKKYNDNYGHIAGDGCLHSLARTLEESLLRPGDMIGRFGGEEFLCVLPEIDSTGVLDVGERLITKTRELAIPHLFSDVANVVTISCGACSIVPENRQTVESLIDLADKALYLSKNSGRNRVTLWNDGKSRQ